VATPTKILVWFKSYRFPAISAFSTLLFASLGSKIWGVIAHS
jgi:hypothetical protein